MTTTKHGYFVDWNGVIRSTENPGDGYSTLISPQETYTKVEVLAEDGEVIHETEWFPSVEAANERMKGN